MLIVRFEPAPLRLCNSFSARAVHCMSCSSLHAVHCVQFTAPSAVHCVHAIVFKYQPRPLLTHNHRTSSLVDLDRRAAQGPRDHHDPLTTPLVIGDYPVTSDGRACWCAFREAGGQSCHYRLSDTGSNPCSSHCRGSAPSLPAYFRKRNTRGDLPAASCISTGPSYTSSSACRRDTLSCAPARASLASCRASWPGGPTHGMQGGRRWRR